MHNSPNSSEFTINSPQCQPYSEASVDLSSLYRPSSIQLEQVECIDETYRLFARCMLPFGECPYCGSKSHHVHSRYIRTISDLSILGYRVIITFESRKFFCTNPECHRKTFAEQPGDEIFRYRRRTRRCEMLVIVSSKVDFHQSGIEKGTRERVRSKVAKFGYHYKFLSSF